MERELLNYFDNDPLRVDVFIKKYALKDEKGNILEKTPTEFFRRIAKAIASVEKDKEYWEEKFYYILKDFKFVPAGRILFGAGNNYIPKNTLLNCYVIPIKEDSIEGIYDCAKEMARTYSWGGGVGCVAKGSFVITKKGVKKIEEVEEGEEILSFNPVLQQLEFKKVIKTHRPIVHRKDNVAIYLKDGTCLITSRWHPTLVFRNNKFQYVPASQVLPTDAMLGTPDLHTLSLECNKLHDTDLGWWVGAHIGNGSASKLKAKEFERNYKDYGKIRERARIRFWSPSKEIAEKYCSIFNKMANSDVKVLYNEPLYEVNTNNYAVIDIIEKFVDGFFGKKATKIRIPRWIWNATRETQIAFLAGLIDTDGYVNTNKNRIEFNTSSKELAYDLKTLLSLLGSGSKIRVKPKNKVGANSVVKQCSESYTVYTYNIKLLSEIVDYITYPEKREKILSIISSNKNKYFVYVPDFVKLFIEQYGTWAVLKEKRYNVINALEKNYIKYSLFEEVMNNIINYYFQNEQWEIYYQAISFYKLCKNLIPVDKVVFEVDVDEEFCDLTVEGNNNYFAGIGGLSVIHNTDISILRPTNSPVLNSARFSTGAVSFMHLFSLTTGLIGQEGRRGALMITIDVSHPDVELFIYAKSKPDFFTLEVIKQNSYKYNEQQLKIIEDILTRQQVKFANISVKIRDEFMKAVLNNDDWELWYPDIVRNPKISESEIEEMLNNNCAITFDRILSPYDVNLYKNEYMLFEAKNGEIEYKGRRFELRRKKVYKVVKARELWDKIVKSAWESAEPGLIFWDTIIKNHNAQYFQPVLSTNPCSEKPLPAYGNCDLGSLNLTKFVKNNDWNYELLKEVIPIAVRFLDNVIDVSKYPLKEQEISSKSARRLGLGILGLADALAMMKIRYDSDEALEKVESLMRFIRDESYRASVNLAKEKGAFEKFDFEKWSNSEFVKRLPKDILEDVKKYGIRNVEILSIAPTGSISILAGNVSSGIEPIFSLKYIRYSLGNFYYVYHPLVKKYLNKNDDEITDEDLKKLPDYFRTAHEINWEYRVKLQGLIQRYVDSAISSTINLPNDIDVETVKKLYFMAWKEGCKGITIYREGSREGVLISEKKEEKKKESSLKPIKKERPFAVSGVTYKIKYKGRKWYVTVNGDEKGMPIEIFAHSSDMVGLEWSTALSMMISAVLRKLSENDDPKFIVENLFKVKEIQGQGYVYKGFYMPSEPSVLGLALKLFIEGVRNGNLEAKGEIATPTLTFIDEKGNIKPKLEMEVLKDAEICPNCSNRTLLKGERAKELVDCSTFCLSCGFSKCD